MSAERMRAWRFYAFGDMRLDEVAVPVPAPDEVLVRVSCVQPSVTEAILAGGGETIAAERVREKIEQAAPVQLFGHEYCARVVAVGGAVRRFIPGDRVAGRSVMPCGTCGLCLTERSDLCSRGPAFGIDYAGCFADYAAIPELALVHVPDAVSDTDGAGLQPLAECVASVESANLRPGDAVLIIGQGAMGLMLTQVARVAGAGTVIALDVKPEALDAARTAGADLAVDGSADELAAEVLAATHGLGADVVFETAAGSAREGLGGAGTMIGAARFVRDSGCIVGVSIIPGDTPLDLLAARARNLSYVFPRHQTLRNLEYAGRLVASGRVRIGEYVTHRVAGIERVPEAFAVTADKRAHGATLPCQVVMSG